MYTQFYKDEHVLNVGRKRGLGTHKCINITHESYVSSLLTFHSSFYRLNHSTIYYQAVSSPYHSFSAVCHDFNQLCITCSLSLHGTE